MHANLQSHVQNHICVTFLNCYVYCTRYTYCDARLLEDPINRWILGDQQVRSFLFLP
jgi:hypothetical protein